MPQEEEVLQDFGFNNIPAGQRSNLMGLYQGLIHRFQAEDLHELRVKGLLVEKIKEHYFAIPKESRGRYFPWFLKNLHIFDRPLTREEAMQNQITTFYEKAKQYVSPEDRHKTAREMDSEAKGSSYNLLAATLSRGTPNPREIGYYSFGFVTCRDQREESMLLDIYQLLLTKSDGSFFYDFHYSRGRALKPVTFTQFWKAYEAGHLIQLMDSKGLKELRKMLPYLEGFLLAPRNGPRPSVWDLKVFLEINDPVENLPCSSVSVDYGFFNCNTFEETCILMEIYGRILNAADPLELHRACLSGTLFEFASNYVSLKKSWRPLMKNLYPLEDEHIPGPMSTFISSLFARLWG